MRNLLIRSFMFIFIFCCSTLKAADAQIKKIIQVAADDWCPVTCALDDKDKPGILVEILNLALAESNFQIKYNVLNWPRAVEMAQAGEIHGILGAYKSDAPNFLFSKTSPLLSRDCFFAAPNSLKNKDWKYTDLKSLTGLEVGIVYGYSYGTQLDQFKESKEGKQIFKTVGGDNPLEQNIQKLKKSRINLLLENDLVIKYKATTMQKTDFDLASKGCVSDKEIFIALSPNKKVLEDNQKIISAIDIFLASKNGKNEVDRIIKKYVTK